MMSLKNSLLVSMISAFGTLGAVAHEGPFDPTSE